MSMYSDAGKIPWLPNSPGNWTSNDQNAQR